MSDEQPKPKRGPLDLAEQLRRAIDDSGLTGRGLAAQACVPPSAVIRFMGRQRDVQLGTAAKLCEVLGLRLVAGARPARTPARRSSAPGMDRKAGKGKGTP